MLTGTYVLAPLPQQSLSQPASFDSAPGEMIEFEVMIRPIKALRVLEDAIESRIPAFCPAYGGSRPLRLIRLACR
jgi:hypothetical protein